MTVCVASIGENSIILGASDRMLTAGDIKFQPPRSKIWQITNSIALMVAGDISTQSIIYQETMRIVVELISKDPDKWLKVKDVAEIYCRAYYDLFSKRSEQGILWPLGLTKDTFISRQKEMAPDFVDKITLELSKFTLRDTSAIIAGTDGEKDRTSPHLFVIQNGSIDCNDEIGFVSIGAGHWHANSQFMFSGHTKSALGSKQLLDTFWAKKRAEVAPGVGSETDMFAIGPVLGSFFRLPEKIINDLEKMYKKYNENVNLVEKRTLADVNKYLTSLAPPKQVQQEPVKDIKPVIKVTEDEIKK